MHTHTPGPYTIDGDCIRGADGIIIAKMIRAHGQIPGEPHPTRSGAYLPDEDAAARYDEEHYEANGALLAGAPKLLDELSSCLALLTSEAATARIQGYEITDLRTWGHRVQQAIDTARAAIRAATGEETP